MGASGVGLTSGLGLTSKLCLTAIFAPVDQALPASTSPGFAWT
ncbi:hypothetical protein BH20CHL6_BH20CHL6_15310 [soil metagenome]